MVSRLDKHLMFNEEALALRSYRQQLLASNIANADTPHYKARDIDFSQKLNEKLGRAQPGQQPEGVLPMTKTSPSHMPPLALEMTSRRHMQLFTETDPAPKKDEPMYRDVIQGSADGNTVDMDVERNNFADNAIRYQFGVNAVSSQIKGMISAIQSNN